LPDTFVWRGKSYSRDVAKLGTEAVRCEESLAYFFRRAWRFIDPAPFVDGWVVDALTDHLEAVAYGDIRRLLINIPPRMLKSSLCSVAFSPWVWAQRHRSATSGPGVSFLHASYAYPLAIRDSVKRRRVVKSTWYQRLFGSRVTISDDQDQKIRFKNTAGGESLITSVDSGVTGEGGGIIIVDDPNNAREALSEAVIESTNEEWWDGSMQTRLNDPRNGAIIVIQQRLGERDLSGHILENDRRSEWTHLCLPMRYESGRSFTTVIGWTDPRIDDGELLWPERFGEEDVDRLERAMGMWRAAGQLQQRPEPKGGGIIKRDWWQLWPPGGEPKDLNGAILQTATFPPCSFILASLDTAYTSKTFNDPSAMTIWGVFPGDIVRADERIAQQVQDIRTDMRAERIVYTETANRVILLNAWSDHLELHGLVQKVVATCRRYKVDKLIIEDKAAGHSVAQEIRRLFQHEDWAVQLINPNRMKNSNGEADKMARLYSIQHLFEERMVYAPERLWSEQVMAQCGTFPNAQNDDLVDTTSAALRHLRDLGMLQRSEELRQEVTEAMKITSHLKPLYPV
jgi:predicted phage terminase large subunit-like protein